MCIVGRAMEPKVKKITKVNFIYVIIYSVKCGAKLWRGEGKKNVSTSMSFLSEGTLRGG